MRSKRVFLQRRIFETSELTSPDRFGYISTMKTPIQTGSSGQVPVPPEKRFPINAVAIVEEFTAV